MKGSNAQTGVSINLDVQNYAAGILPLLVNGLAGLKQRFKDAVLTQNNTLNSNHQTVISSIRDAINNKLVPLTKAKNATTKVYASMLNATVNATVTLGFQVIATIGGVRAKYLNLLYVNADSVTDQMKGFMSNMLKNVNASITNTNININTASGCRDTATNSLNNVFIQFSNDMKTCAMGYNGNDTVIRTKLDQTYRDIQAAALTLLNNITTCASINQLSDTNSIDATTNCTRTSFLNCLDVVIFLGYALEILTQYKYFSQPNLLSTYKIVSQICSTLT